ncbi:MAG: flagellar biosynthetic protein FliO [bacterium]
MSPSWAKSTRAESSRAGVGSDKAASSPAARRLFNDEETGGEETGEEGTKESQPSVTMDLLKERFSERSASLDAPSQPAPFFGFSVLKAALSLSLVLAIIWAMSYLVKKYYLRGNLPGGKFIRLLDTCSLGTRGSLALVRVENQTLLLGITGQEITLLSQVNPAEKKGAEEAGSRPKEPEDYSTVAHRAEQLSQQLSRNTLKYHPLKPEPGSTDSIAGILESRFKGLKKI